MNWVDGAILGSLLVYGLLGWKRGFLVVASELVTLGVGLGAAVLLFRPVGAVFAAARGVDEGLAQGVAFLVVWVLVQTLAALAFRVWLRKVPVTTHRATTNRLLGVFPSLLKGLAGVALMAALLSVWPTGTMARSVKGSLLGRPMAAAVMRHAGKVYNTFAGAFRMAQKRFGPDPVVEGGRQLPFRTTDVAVAPEAEAEMLRLLNGERVKAGLEPLKADTRLRAVARAHSRDMMARGYFSHNTPEGRSPFDRMHAAGVVYRAAGENLALAPSVDVAHQGLMESPGHRKNILTPEFRRVGIGALRSDERGIMFTQNFMN